MTDIRGTQDIYMLVRRGHVQRYEIEAGGREIKAWPIFTDRSLARRIADSMANRVGRTLTIARIGSIDGETVAGHARLAMAEDCTHVIWIHGWGDGEPDSVAYPIAEFLAAFEEQEGGAA